MGFKFSRRQFIHLVAASTATICGGGLLAGCVSEEWLQVFPQGVASGDPRSDSVLLWTRIQTQNAGPVSVDYEVARDEDFTQLIAHGTIDADPAWDHTLRIRLENLSPYTVYYYRFQALNTLSATGRTKTAPDPEQDIPVRFAVASCQDYVGRWYHSWQRVFDEPDIDFVLFLGDYIYETVADPRHQVPRANRRLVLPDGTPLSEEEGDLKAVTLADYRALYKQYKTDPDLIEVHRRFPFVTIWDDHEFANDCWQDHATDTNELFGTERETDRRQAASRAWFEFTAIDVAYAAQRPFPEDITIYRSLRFGKHLELVLTDLRYYREDHLIPEGPIDLSVGKFLENSPLGSRIFAQKESFDEKESALRPSMLGSEQKQWLVDQLNNSEATWKAWGSALMVAQMTLNLSEVEGMPELFAQQYYFKVDHWDGFRSERFDILEAVSGIDNLLVLSGDLHGFYAAEVAIDADKSREAENGQVVATEFTTSSISSIPLLDQLRGFTSTEPMLAALGLGPFVEQLDHLLIESNQHFAYADSEHNGIMFVDVDEHRTEVAMVQLLDVTNPAGPATEKRTVFRVEAGSTAIVKVAG